MSGRGRKLLLAIIEGATALLALAFVGYLLIGLFGSV